ncbi:MAG: thiamine phosphate synthase [Pseudomonadota bacterium]
MDHQTKLYLITPPRLDDSAAFLRELEAVLATGAVTAVQLRLKESDGATADIAGMKAIAESFVSIVQAGEAVALINDSVEITEVSGADGVHLGQSDGSIKEARARLGDEAIIGATCHDSRHLAMVAGEQGADYVAFGAFFDTGTKETDYRPEPELLTWWQELMEIPCVAIGGITVDNAAGLVRAGADFLAVSSGIWAYPDGPAAGAKAFKSVIDANVPACETT